MSRKPLIGGALILALLLVGLFGSTTLADTTSTDNGADKMKAATQTFITDLATNLGVSESTLETALEATQKEILANEVTAGTITQDQADKISAQGFNFGACIGGHGAGGPPPDGKGGPGGAPPSTSSTSSSTQL